MTEGRQTARQAQEAERLQVSKRLDWRFLLPDCRLEHVAFDGDPRSSLLASLETFSQTVTLLTRGVWLAGDDRQFDVLVLQDPSRHALHRARHLLRPGGCLYAEIHRRFSLRPATVLHPASYAAAARRGGFTGIELHWHWPDFERCTRIVPMRTGAPFAYLLSKGRTDATARAKAAVGRVLLDQGLLGWGIACFSILALSPFRAPGAESLTR